MGSSSSTSSTSQTTQAINPVALASDNATAVNAVVNGSGNSQVLNVTTLNADVANHAMDTALTATQDALLFGADAQKQAYGFAAQSNAATLAFADASNAATLNFASTTSNAAQKTAQTAIGSAETAYQRALTFGSEQTGVALDALAQSSKMIDTAYKDAKGVLGTNVILVGIGATVIVLYLALKK